MSEWIVGGSVYLSPILFEIKFGSRRLRHSFDCFRDSIEFLEHLLRRLQNGILHPIRDARAQKRMCQERIRKFLCRINTKFCCRISHLSTAKMAARNIHDVLARTRSDATRIDISHCAILNFLTVAHLFARFKNVEELIADSCGLLNLWFMPYFPRLRKLDLSYNALTGGLDTVANCCPYLQVLILVQNPISQLVSLRPMIHMQSLLEVDLYGCSVLRHYMYTVTMAHWIPRVWYTPAWDYDSESELESDYDSDEDSDWEMSLSDNSWEDSDEISDLEDSDYANEMEDSDDDWHVVE